jgi:hypothetical protein
LELNTFKNVTFTYYALNRVTGTYVQCPDWLWGPFRLYPMDIRFSFVWRVKRLRREANHSPPSTAEVKNAGAIHPLYYVSSWHRAQIIKHRDNSTFIAYASIICATLETAARRDDGLSNNLCT